MVRVTRNIHSPECPLCLIICSCRCTVMIQIKTTLTETWKKSYSPLPAVQGRHSFWQRGLNCVAVSVNGTLDFCFLDPFLDDSFSQHQKNIQSECLIICECNISSTGELALFSNFQISTNGTTYVYNSKVISYRGESEVMHDFRDWQNGVLSLALVLNLGNTVHYFSTAHFRVVANCTGSAGGHFQGERAAQRYHSAYLSWAHPTAKRAVRTLDQLVSFQLLRHQPSGAR